MCGGAGCHVRVLCSIASSQQAGLSSLLRRIRNHLTTPLSFQAGLLPSDDGQTTTVSQTEATMLLFKVELLKGNAASVIMVAQCWIYSIKQPYWTAAENMILFHVFMLISYSWVRSDTHIVIKSTLTMIKFESYSQK